MPNILVLSLIGTSFFAEPRYSTLLPKILSRASVHEALTVADAKNYVQSWSPSVILVTDAVITYRQNHDIAKALAKWVHNGGIAILMGLFAADVEWPDLNSLFQLFQKNSSRPWTMVAYSRQHVKLNRIVKGLRTNSLSVRTHTKGMYLKDVAMDEMIYSAKSGDLHMCSTAFGQTGYGWLGYIGDMEFSEDAERTILAMCRLDEPDA
jgi:hypothetical protein